MNISEECHETVEPPWDKYHIDSSRSTFIVDAAWKYLSTEAYWGRDRTKDIFLRQLDKALMVFGLFVKLESGSSKMVGMARIVGDWDANMLMDVYIEKEHQGGGLGTKFIEVVLNGDGRVNWRWLLYTGDRMDWYTRKFGFKLIGPASREGMLGFSYCIMERDAKAIKHEQSIAKEEDLRKFLSPKREN